MARFNQYADQLSDANRRSYLGAFNALQGDSVARNAADRSLANPDRSAVTAFNQTGDLARNAISWGQALDTNLTGQLAETAGYGISQAAQQAEFNQRMETEREYTRIAKDVAAAQKGGGFLGFIGKAIGIASLFCERRFKQAIASLDADTAWAAIRDLPLYRFEYRQLPGMPAYGPMVDEVEAIAPELLISMDAEAEALGWADGQPVRGIDRALLEAYESTALQQALLRIEALEARLNALESAAAKSRPTLALVAA